LLPGVTEGHVQTWHGRGIAGAPANVCKPAGISGAEVEKYFRDGHIREIADYCKSDVVNTYRVWLRYELFRGNLTEAAFQASELSLADFIKARDSAMTSRLTGLM